VSRAELPNARSVPRYTGEAAVAFRQLARGSLPYPRLRRGGRFPAALRPGNLRARLVGLVEVTPPTGSLGSWRPIWRRGPCLRERKFQRPP
jgi:hypothetical protein